MVNYRAIAIVFVVLTIVFAAATGYFVAHPATTTRTVMSTQTTTAFPSYTVNIAYKSGIGFYLTNATGFTLYFLSTDTQYSGKTTCTTDQCEKSWPVFYSSTLNLPPGLNASSFSTITAYNTTKILTYDGYPLFYWVGDSKAGSTTGQGIGNFYVCTFPVPTK